jgi:hypothetical protein
MENSLQDASISLGMQSLNRIFNPLCYYPIHAPNITSRQFMTQIPSTKHQYSAERLKSKRKKKQMNHLVVFLAWFD